MNYILCQIQAIQHFMLCGQTEDDEIREVLKSLWALEDSLVNELDLRDRRFAQWQARQSSKATIKGTE
jgi:hypothetical protein